MPTFKYCPLCATPLETRYIEHGHHSVCPQCGFVDWKNAKPCICGLIVKDGRVLLVKRGIEPFKGLWDIPGGFLDSNEHPEAGLRRELFEETSLEVRPVRILDIIIDVYGDATKTKDLDYTLNIFYLAEPTGGRLNPGDDAIEARWFPLHNLPLDAEIAFECNRTILHLLKEQTST